MTTDAEAILDADALPAPTDRQRLFMRYFTAILVDLAVLNLFAEYWDRVVIASFTVSLFAAILLQLLLRVTVAIEHRAAEHFNAKSGGLARFMRYASAWIILFGSKFAILGALHLFFGDSVHFVGAVHGIVPLLTVIVAMLVAEELVVRVYRRLG